MSENSGQLTVNKARIWNAVLYPENMIEDWQDQIIDLVPFPLAYCIHDKDIDSTGEPAKVHVHVMAAWPNTTTPKHALAVFSQLSRPGCKCVNKVEPCLNARRSYEYLIHNTENARKKGKHLYDRDERIECNNFDIARFEQLSQQEKDEMLIELCDFIIANSIVNMRDAYIQIQQNFDTSYFAIFRANNGLINRLCKGNYDDKRLRGVL